MASSFKRDVQQITFFFVESGSISSQENESQELNVKVTSEKTKLESKNLVNQKQLNEGKGDRERNMLKRQLPNWVADEFHSVIETVPERFPVSVLSYELSL